MLVGAALLLTRLQLRNRGDVLFLGLAFLVVLAYASVLDAQLSTTGWSVMPRDPIWSQMTGLLGGDRDAPLSVARSQPFLALANPLVCLGMMVGAASVSTSSRNADRLFKTIAWSGFGYAVYGIAAYLADPSVLLGREKLADKNVLNGTFPNRNTAALYFGLCGMMWAVLFARQLTGKGLFRSRRSFRAVRWTREMVIATGGFAACLVSALLTGSRAGVAISLVAIVTAVLLLLRREFGSRRAVNWAILVAAVIACGIVGLFGGQVSERLGAYGLNGGGRWQTYVSTWRMISDHPLVGTGFGTFRFIFPRYRSGDVSIWGIWDRAHDTPLELAAEGGVPLALLVIAAWLVVLVVLFQGAIRRRRGAVYPVAGFVGGCMALGHSLIDFSLQIPGFAVPLFCLVGIGLAQRGPRLGESGLEKHCRGARQEDQSSGQG